MNRRLALIIALASVILVGVFFIARGQAAAEPIRVGVLHSLTGTMGISEKPVVDAELMAIDEINQKGGVLGRQIQPIVVDGQSDWATFANEAQRLITEE